MVRNRKTQIEVVIKYFTSSPEKTLHPMLNWPVDMVGLTGGQERVLKEHNAEGIELWIHRLFHLFSLVRAWWL